MIWAEPVNEQMPRFYAVTKIGTNCGKSFYIKDKEMSYYVQNGFPVPKICYNCRKVRNQKRDNFYGV